MKKNRQALIEIVIIFSISIFFSLPPGVHLELCFGFDGHVDATPGSCIADRAGQLRQQVGSTDEHHHHGNCLDIVIGCTSWDILAHTTEKGNSFKTNTVRIDPATIVEYIHNAAQTGRPSNRSTFLHNGDMPSPLLLSHQTVVLLI